MAASSKLMITEAERRFPCRIKLGVPTGGFGTRLTEMHAWLDENCGADGWAMTPAGLRGVVNDAVAVYFLDATVAAAFVARWCPAQPPRSATGPSACGRISRHAGSQPGRTRLSKVYPAAPTTAPSISRRVRLHDRAKASGEHCGRFSRRR